MQIEKTVTLFLSLFASSVLTQSNVVLTLFTFLLVFLHVTLIWQLVTQEMATESENVVKELYDLAYFGCY